MATTGSLGTSSSTPGAGLLPGSGPSSSSPATAFTISGPSTGVVGSASSNFIFTPNGTYTGTLTPTMSGLAGTWSPTTLTWTGDASSKTATFTASAAGSGNANASSSPSLTAPSDSPFTASTNTAYWSFIFNTGLVTPTFVVKNMVGGVVTPVSGGTPVNQGSGAWSASFTAPPADYVGVWTVSGVDTVDPARVANLSGDYFATISGVPTGITPTYVLHDQSGSTVGFTSGGTVVSQGNGVFTTEFVAPAGSLIGVWSSSGVITLEAPNSTNASGGGGTTTGFPGPYLNFSDTEPFYPVPFQSVKIVANGTSSNVALQTSNVNTDFNFDRVRVASLVSGADCWVKFGKDNTATAVVDVDLYIQAGKVEVLRIPKSLNYMAVVTGGSSATVWALRGSK